MTHHRCFIGLGSNLDQPIAQIQTAILALGTLPNTRLVAASGLWTSKPMGPSDQPDYVNAVAEIDTLLSPESLLLECQSIETAQHRIRTRHWGPRTIDVDILLYGDMTVDTADLKIPHPGVTDRAFVLAPLQQLAPETQVLGRTVRDWYSDVNTTDLVLLSGHSQSPRP